MARPKNGVFNAQPVHQLNCAKLKPHVVSEPAEPCSCGAEKTGGPVHRHGPDEGRGLDCPEYMTPEGRKGQCMLSFDDLNRETIVPVGYDQLAEHHGVDDEAATVSPVDSEDLAGTLMGWWMQKAQEEAETVVPKATEYGGASRAADLTQIGRSMAELMNSEFGARYLSDAQLQELACYFYLQGKMGRWHAALMEGRRVSDDTIYDIGIYIKMVQRIRESGGWPV